MKNPVQKAIDLVGSQSRLAELCDIWPQTVSKWLYKGYVPFESVEKVIFATNGEMTALELCPPIKNLIKAHKQAKTITPKP